MPGLHDVYRETSDSLPEQIGRDLEQGINKFLLFGIPATKATSQFDHAFTAAQIANIKRHFGDRVVLRPLSTFTSGRSYFRRVLLVQEYSGHPVEMGAIRMRLDAFGPTLRSKIRKNQIPLGRILRDGRFTYANRVRAFLAVTPSPEMMGVFWMRQARVLYGRRNEIHRDGVKIADIVEVLPMVFR